MNRRAAHDLVLEAQNVLHPRFDPVLEHAAVEFGDVAFLGEVGGEGGGAELFLEGVLGGDGGGSLDGWHGLGGRDGGELSI
jgi:hypothetical protein